MTNKSKKQLADDCSYIDNLSHEELKNEFRKVWEQWGKEIKAKHHMYLLVTERNKEAARMQQQIGTLKRELMRYGDPSIVD